MARGSQPSRGKSVQFTVTLSGSSVATLTEFLIEGVSDYRPMWIDVANHWRSSRAVLFASQGRTEGSPWPGYLAREKQYKTVKGIILGKRIRSDDQLRWEIGHERLRPSMTDATNRLHIDRRTKTRIVLGTSLPYAANHEFGLGRAPRWAGGYAIPRRRIMTVGPRLLRTWEDDMIRFATTVVTTATRTSQEVTGLRARGGLTL